MTHDEHSRRVSATLSLGLPGIPPLTHQEATAQIVGSLLDDAAERMTALVERIVDPPGYRNHGEEIAAALDGTHHSMKVSDQEALAIANQHEIQRDLKW